MRRRGFTLLEVLIAIAVGAVLVTVALQAVRVAAQCATAARRLAVENALMRAGCSAAHDRVDYWTDLDDPDDPGRQTLRGSAGGEGLPFSRMVDVDPRSGSDRRHERGWDESYLWPAADPRSWWRGNGVESARTELSLGRYAIVAASEPNLADVGDPSIAGPYGAVEVAWSWLPRQYHDLFNALGFYGAIEYLPGNALYGYYGPWHAAGTVGGDQSIDGETDAGGIPFMLQRCDSRFVDHEGVQVTQRGLWRLSQASGYALVPGESAGSTAAAIVMERQRWNISHDATAASLTQFIALAIPASGLLPLAPAHWPLATVATGRYIKSRRFINLTTLRWRSPITGETAGLSFSTCGTTLRGARQQRHRDGGWARWDDVGAHDPTLDSP